LEKFEQGTRYGKRGFKGEPLDLNTNLDGFEHLDVGSTKEIDTHGAISNGGPQATLNRKFSSLTEQVRELPTKLLEMENLNYIEICNSELVDLPQIWKEQQKITVITK
jgi:hypothetical protein